MTLRTATLFLRRAVATGAILLAAAPGAFAQASRLGATSYPGPPDGNVRRFPSVAYDPVNNAYLVTWSLNQIGARFVSADGAPLGSPAVVVGAGGGGVRAACGGPAINACLIAWVEEPASIKGRFVRYGGGAVQFLTSPFLISGNGRPKLTSNAATVAYSSVANEFLVAWTEFGVGGPDVTARRVAASAALLGGEIAIAWTSGWEGFPSATYNSALGQFLVAYYFETSSSNVSVQRVQSGSGALVGGRSTLYGSAFEQYPEIAYNSVQNQYLAITWGFGGLGWMLHGGLADGNAQPYGGVLSLAAGGGGDGIGLAYNPVRNTYFAVYQSQNNAEVWGVEIGPNGVPGSQFQVTSSGTQLSVQPRVAASTVAPRWYAVASENFKQIMGQLIGSGGALPSGGGSSPPPPSSGCTTVQPASDWVCVNGNWLPPGSGGGGTTTPPPPPPPSSSCTTAQPVPGWVCISGNWLPPDHPLVLAGGGGTTTPPPPPPPPPSSSCTTPQPGSDWVCMDGNWLPQGLACPTPQPVAGWVCVAGNWLPPDHPDATGGGGGGTVVQQPASSCTTPSPGTGWFCYNGNWLPPGYPIGDDD